MIKFVKNKKPENVAVKIRKKSRSWYSWNFRIRDIFIAPEALHPPLKLPKVEMFDSVEPIGIKIVVSPRSKMARAFLRRPNERVRKKFARAHGGPWHLALNLCIGVCERVCVSIRPVHTHDRWQSKYVLLTPEIICMHESIIPKGTSVKAQDKTRSIDSQYQKSEQSDFFF